jgi:hypothetical protein
MSVAVITKWGSGMTADKYHELALAMNLEDSLPMGCESHVAGIAEDGTFIVSDIWESSEASETFMRERLCPTLDILGLVVPDAVMTLDLVSINVASFHRV